MLPQYTQWLQTQGPQKVSPTPQTQVPPTGTPSAPPLAPTYTPYGAPYTPTYTREQEKQMLDQQVKILEAQLDAIRKRLEELSK
jgi:hypothetical protein